MQHRFHCHRSQQHFAWVAFSLHVRWTPRVYNILYIYYLTEIGITTPRQTTAGTKIGIHLTRLVVMSDNHFENEHIFDQTRIDPTFWTERVTAALHLPTNPWSFFVTLKWFECTALNSSLILPDPACRNVGWLSSIFTSDYYKHAGLQRLSSQCVLLTTHC